MGFTYKLGSKLIIDDGENRYQILVADFNFSETFIERGYDVSTLHDSKAISNSTFTNSKSNASFDFEFYFGLNPVVEKKLLEWYGFTDVGSNTLNFPESRGSLDSNKFDIYIDMGSTVILIDNSVLENFSLRMDPRGVLSASISGKGQTSVISSVSLPTVGTLYEQGSFGNYPIEASINSVNQNNLRGATLELTKSVQWLNSQSVHDALSDSLYIPEYAVAKDLAVAGNTTITKTNDNEPQYLDLASMNIQLGNYMTINLENCNITQRVDLGSGVLSLVSDFKLLNATGSYIQF